MWSSSEFNNDRKRRRTTVEVRELTKVQYITNIIKARRDNVARYLQVLNLIDWVQDV